MTPEFALILSSDGIVLLKREAKDWSRIGAASLGSETFTNDLENVRKTGQDLSAGTLYCKLVIPDDQIRYLTIETGDIPKEQRFAWARQALEGATPYAVNDLAFDLSADGAQTHIAAVALETLDEAENFAYEHGFTPSCFVASPTAHSYLGEPFFGARKHFPDAKQTGNTTAIVESALLDDDQNLAQPIAKPNILPPAPIEATLDGVAPFPLSPEVQIYDEAPALSDPLAPIGFSSRRQSPLSGTIKDPAPEFSPVAPDTHLQDSPAVATIPAAPVSGHIPSPYASRESDTRLATPPLNPALRATSAPAKATRIAAPSVILEDEIKNARPLKPTSSTTRVVFGALACGACAATVWAASVHLPPLLWENLDEADLITPQNTISAPIITSDTLTTAPSQSGTISAQDPSTTASSSAPVSQNKNDLALHKTDAETLAPTQEVLVPDLPEPQLINRSLQQTENHTRHDTPANLGNKIAPQKDSLPNTENLTTAGGSDQKLQNLQSITQYAATGIWQQEPKLPSPLQAKSLTNIILASASTGASESPIKTAPYSLQTKDLLGTDKTLSPLVNPPTPSQVFNFDERGLVTASRQGSINPDGVMIYDGQSGPFPPTVPDRSPVQETSSEQDTTSLAAVTGKRPRLRPQRAVETVPQITLSQKRPRLRPKTLQLQANAIDAALASVIADTRIETEIIAQSTKQNSVIVKGARPKLRPANFSNRLNASKQQNIVASNSAGPQPNLKSPASVSRQATESNALNLRRLNLIGISGSPSNRRALIRLPSGRYVKVKIGDRIDGGRVIAISDNQVQYRKGNNNTTLQMPRG